MPKKPNKDTNNANTTDNSEDTKENKKEPNNESDTTSTDDVDVKVIDAKLTDVEKVKEFDGVVVWRPIRPLTVTQHAIVSGILRDEQEKSGVKIVLMPYLCKVGE